MESRKAAPMPTASTAPEDVQRLLGVFVGLAGLDHQRRTFRRIYRHGVDVGRVLRRESSAVPEAGSPVSSARSHDGVGGLVGGTRPSGTGRRPCVANDEENPILGELLDVLIGCELPRVVPVLDVSRDGLGPALDRGRHVREQGLAQEEEERDAQQQQDRPDGQGV